MNCELTSIVVAFVHVARLCTHAVSALSNAHSLQVGKSKAVGNVECRAQYIYNL